MSAVAPAVGDACARRRPRRASIGPRRRGRVGPRRAAGDRRAVVDGRVPVDQRARGQRPAPGPTRPAPDATVAVPTTGRSAGSLMSYGHRELAVRVRLELPEERRVRERADLVGARVERQVPQPAVAAARAVLVVGEHRLHGLARTRWCRCGAPRAVTVVGEVPVDHEEHRAARPRPAPPRWPAPLLPPSGATDLRGQVRRPCRRSCASRRSPAGPGRRPAPACAQSSDVVGRR